jgi:hypothetical protein
MSINFHLTGLYNVLLFLYMHPGLLLFTPASPTQGDELMALPDVEMERLFAPHQQNPIVLKMP